MEKISFEELCKLVAHIDYIDSNSYPVSFVIKDKGKEPRRFECGIGKADNNVWFCRSFGGETELQYMLSEKDGIVDLQDPDMMVFDKICEMLKAKCKIGAESEILLNDDISFDGEELHINEFLLSDKLRKELEDINLDKPSYNEAAKMFDIVDSYLCEIRNIGWQWDEAVKYIQEHWNDTEFNIDYFINIEKDKLYQ